MMHYAQLYNELLFSFRTDKIIVSCFSYTIWFLYYKSLHW